MDISQDIELTTDLVQLITADQAWYYSIVPRSKNASGIEFYISKEKNIRTAGEELEMLLGNAVKLTPVEASVINRAIGKYYRKSSQNGKDEKASVFVQKTDDFLVNIIAEANGIGCSDIHIEAYEDKCRVRMRIDGKLVERYILKKEEYPAIINKIKIKANLDIAEKRLPQDGRIFFTSQQTKFDIRVSVLPTLHGEKIVLRLLSKDATNIEIKELGFSEIQLAEYYEGIKRPNGIILISGPTGSGKTTTLYATLKILNKEASNILTIEDPIEYTLEGINQVQLKEAIGLTFSSALRTFLRQDPDIIMLGEIRDGETAQMAIRAALTGHLVLSTIHTNSAWGTISRLIDMGVPAFLLANTLNLSVAQRLVRLLCPECKEQQPFTSDSFPRHYKPPHNLNLHYIAKGCRHCFFTGYRGRKAIYEVIPIDHEFSELIKSGHLNASAIIKKKNIKNLGDSAFELLEQGITSIEEVYPLLLNN